MEFYGAEEYYFYMGLKKGVNGSLSDLDAWMNNRIVINLETAQICLEAFVTGFFWGMAMTQAEYEDLFIVIKEELPVFKPEYPDIETTDDAIQVNIDGNC